MPTKKTIKYFLTHLGLITVLLQSQIAFPLSFQGLLQSRIEGGGEKLHSVLGRTKEGYRVERSVSSGGGYTFSLGAMAKDFISGKENLDLELQGIAGFKHESTGVRGAKGALYSFPIDGFLFFRYKDLKVGFGPNYNYRASYTDEDGISHKALSSINPVAEAQLFAHNVGLGLRIGQSAYEIKGKKRSGLTFGLTTTFAFF